MSLISAIQKRISARSWRLKSLFSLMSMISKKRGLLVLMYHSTPKHKSEYSYAIHEQAFSEQIDFLHEYFHVLSMVDVKRFIDGTQSPTTSQPMAAITFDDGYRNNMEVAWPILRQYNLPFTIFLTTNFITQNNKTFMSWDEIKSLQSEGLATFGAHCQNHFNLKALEEEDKTMEIVGSKQIIEERTGNAVNTFAYPGGGYDEQCLEIVNKHFQIGFKDRCSGNDADPRKIARVSVDARHDDFKMFLIELARSPFLGAKR